MGSQHKGASWPNFLELTELEEFLEKSLTLEFIHDMTLSIGTYFQKGPILIGFDGRNSSPTICKIVTSALNSIGIDCNIAGIVPTPCLEFAVKKLEYTGGMMITASHNPSRI